ncbi:MAG: hypothetical protein COB78_00805 [Hyphomicrobiales bacterium]|nr:MAG: hypothetical protein COB78_00805 [Hyphomicrobiales bacterium]
MADKSYRLWVWEPKQLTWWVATLFMIGAALFALGCVLYLAAIEHELILDSVFFVGSLFFTSAAYCQFHQSRNGNKTVFYSALSQFFGTLMFNMNTFDAFFDLGWMEQDLLIWTPNILGSILFQISGCLAMKDLCKRWWCWNFQSISWWIGVINFVGCVAFLLSAILSFVMPVPIPAIFAIWATVLTLLGACCFFIGAFLMWPEMAANEERAD